jgi:SAM-dependent methyltransferase
MATEAVDEAKVEEFTFKAIGDFAGAMTMFQCAVGDRLGLFKTLADGGPATSDELAERAGISERYALEWLRAMRAAEYLDFDRESGKFSLSPEHAMVLAAEGSPFFFGGGFQMIPGMVPALGRVVEAFEKGDGAPQDAYGEDWWVGMERFTNGWFENFLLQEWIPAMPDVKQKLESGALVADVGCGGGRALIKLAQEFPNSRFVGYDIFQTQVDRATANAEQAGVGDRIKFEVRDVVEGMPEQYDAITTFDVIHDAVDPVGLLKGIREGLKEDGSYVLLDINCADDPADNEGPLATMFYGFSVFYCMTTSLAHGGEGLGTCGLPEAKVRELCDEAGFGDVRRLPIENPFNVLYEIKR